MSDKADTRELRETQLRRQLEEQELASSAADEEEISQHQRRAEKAAYLRRKLEERAESEAERD